MKPQRALRYRREKLVTIPWHRGDRLGATAAREFASRDCIGGRVMDFDQLETFLEVALAFIDIAVKIKGVAAELSGTG